MYKNEGDLVLRDLKTDQSGQYHCKASSLTGTIKSQPALLTILGKCRINSYNRLGNKHHRHLRLNSLMAQMDIYFGLDSSFSRLKNGRRETIMRDDINLTPLKL